MQRLAGRPRVHSHCLKGALQFQTVTYAFRQAVEIARDIQVLVPIYPRCTFLIHDGGVAPTVSNHLIGLVGIVRKVPAQLVLTLGARNLAASGRNFEFPVGQSNLIDCSGCNFMSDLLPRTGGRMRLYLLLMVGSGIVTAL